MHDVPACKEPNGSQPVPTAWRATVREIVHALLEGDYSLTRGVASVAPVSPLVAEQMRSYVLDHGETLLDLPDDAWETSVCQWTGSHWDVLVDLWTVESGASDLVLNLRVFDEAKGFRFEVDSVTVP